MAHKGTNIAPFVSDFIRRAFAKLLPPAFLVEESGNVLEAYMAYSVITWGIVTIPY